MIIPLQHGMSKPCRANWKFSPFPSRCSSAKIKAVVFGLLPVLSWLPKYKIKDYIVPDLLGGLSGGSIQVPQGEGAPLARPGLPLPQPFLSIPTPSVCDPHKSVVLLSFNLVVLCRHGICSAGQPSCSQWPLLLLLPPPDLLLPGGSAPDGAR